MFHLCVLFALALKIFTIFRLNSLSPPINQFLLQSLDFRQLTLNSLPVVCTVPEEANMFLAELLIDVLELVELLLEGAALVLLLAHLLLLLHQAGQGRHLSLVKGQ